MTWGDLDVRPTDATIHVGAMQRFEVSQAACPSNDDCGPFIPTSWTVAIRSGMATIELSNIQRSVPGQYSIADFDLAGVVAGDATLEITGEDGFTTTLAVHVVP